MVLFIAAHSASGRYSLGSRATSRNPASLACRTSGTAFPYQQLTPLSLRRCAPVFDLIRISRCAGLSLPPLRARVVRRDSRLLQPCVPDRALENIPLLRLYRAAGRLSRCGDLKVSVRCLPFAAISGRAVRSTRSLPYRRPRLYRGVCRAGVRRRRGDFWAARRLTSAMSGRVL
jgi:hypothetical protein